MGKENYADGKLKIQEEHRQAKILNTKIFKRTGWNSELEAFVIMANNGEYVFEEKEIQEGATNVFVCWYDKLSKIYNIASGNQIITQFFNSTWADTKETDVPEITLLTRLFMISKVREHMNL